LRHSTLKTEDLPRQARDKHRKSWKQDTLPQVESEYLPVFAAGVAAGAQGVMPSYNSIDGVPVAADKWLLTDMLRTGAKRPLHILLVLSSSSSFSFKNRHHLPRQAADKTQSKLCFKSRGILVWHRVGF
jgi:hypothetical protein